MLGCVSWRTRRQLLISDPILANARQHEVSIAARIAVALRNSDFQNITVLTHNYTKRPVWTVPEDTFCDRTDYPTKKTALPQVMRIMLEEHRAVAHVGAKAVYTDGTKTTSIVACAAVSDDIVVSQKLNSGSSIFTAELRAIMGTLQIVEETEGKLICDI